MTSIFLQYEVNLLNPNGLKRSAEDIINILKVISPPHVKPVSHKVVNVNGKDCVFVKYRSDKDINFIFTSENISKLKQADIKAEITKDYKSHREIYIREVPEYILNKPETELKNELESAYNLNILYLNKFSYIHQTYLNDIRYLIIALDSKEARNNFTAVHKSVKLFNSVLPAEAKRPSYKKTLRSPQPQRPIHSQVQSYTTPSAQHLGKALANGSSWAGPRYNTSVGNYQHQRAPGYTTLRPKQYSSHQPLQQYKPPAQHHTSQPHLGCNPHSQSTTLASTSAQNPSHQHRDNGRLLLEATNLACKTLSQGLEHPEIYVIILNITLAHMGHPMVSIPNSVFEISKDIYHSKESNAHVNINNSIPNSTPIPSQPHPPSPTSQPSLLSHPNLPTHSLYPHPPPNHQSQPPSQPPSHPPTSQIPPNHLSQHPSHPPPNPTSQPPPNPTSQPPPNHLSQPPSHPPPNLTSQPLLNPPSQPIIPHLPPISTTPHTTINHTTSNPPLSLMD